nr:putative reverse transcriptase domain-containing protein [Tanacetum cinerariifolium]
GVTIMVSEPGYETVGSKDLTCEDWMVNTRNNADLSAAVQNALQTLLPQIRAEIREEFCTSSGPSDAGGNPPLIFDVMGFKDAFKTRLAVYKFEGNALAWWKACKQAKGGDAWLITVTWAEFKKLFFLQFFPRAEQERLKREYHSIHQTNTKTSTESTLNHLMCMSYTDVAQVANAARNYEILHEMDDDDAERPDKRQKSGDRYQPTSQQSSHRNHGHNNDRHGSDRRGGGDNHHSNNNYSGNNNRLNFKSIRSSSTHKHDPNITGKLNPRYVGPFKKSYADLKRKPMEFQVGDKVMLKVLPWKGVVLFGKQGKLNPRVHNTFHVSNLKKCHADEPLAVPLDGLHFDDKLHLVEEPVEIVDRKVKRLKQSRIPLVKVRWNSKRGPEFT